MLRIDDRLARAGEKFLLSKTVETWLNILGFIAMLAVAGLVGAWLVFQVQAMARGMGM